MNVDLTIWVNISTLASIPRFEITCFVWYLRHHVARLKGMGITEFGPCQKINKH